jgi:hypothetical protein
MSWKDDFTDSQLLCLTNGTGVFRRRVRLPVHLKYSPEAARNGNRCSSRAPSGAYCSRTINHNGVHVCHYDDLQAEPGGVWE